MDCQSASSVTINVQHSSPITEQNMSIRTETVRNRAVLRATMLPLLLAAATSTLQAQTPAADAPLPPAKEIIDRYVQAIGGERAVLGHSSIVSTGTIEMPSAGVKGDLELVQTPEKTAMTITIPGIGELVTVYDGTTAWSINPMQGPRVLEGKELAQMQEESGYASILRRSPHVTKVETVARTEMGGSPCYEVRFTYASGRETSECYSVETGLLVGSKQKQETTMGVIEVTTLASEWRDFDGLKSATVLRQQMMGQEQILRISDIDYGTADVAATFAVPASIQGILKSKEGAARPVPPALR